MRAENSFFCEQNFLFREEVGKLKKIKIRALFTQKKISRAQHKWEYRKRYEEVEEYEIEEEAKEEDRLDCVPNEMMKILNIMNRA